LTTLNRPLGRFFTAACIIASSVGAFAEVTWDSVKSKVSGAQSYQVDYKYDGPKGNFKFDYRVVMPDKIRTEIKESKSDSSRVGSVIVYDGAWNKDKVRAKSGGGLITRNTTHKDVEGTPFATPLFSMILSQIGGAKPTVVAEGDRTRFDFKTGGGTYSVWANKNSEIVKTERIDKQVKETREFTQIRWNGNPSVTM
jgi:hypothetical protein